MLHWQRQDLFLFDKVFTFCINSTMYLKQTKYVLFQVHTFILDCQIQGKHFIKCNFCLVPHPQNKVSKVGTTMLIRTWRTCLSYLKSVIAVRPHCGTPDWWSECQALSQRGWFSGLYILYLSCSDSTLRRTVIHPPTAEYITWIGVKVSESNYTLEDLLLRHTFKAHSCAPF